MPIKKTKNEDVAESRDVFQSHHLAEKTTDEPLIRVMALHALAYCERLFYLEEVEEIRVADANVYAGRRIHEKLDKGPDIYPGVSECTVGTAWKGRLCSPPIGPTRGL
jgi:hypothetical protein